MLNDGIKINVELDEIYQLGTQLSLLSVPIPNFTILDSCQNRIVYNIACLNTSITSICMQIWEFESNLFA